MLFIGVMRRHTLTAGPSRTPLQYREDRRRRLSADDGVAGFSPADIDITVSGRTQAFATWADVAGAAMAA
jgi:hypothetical protein